MTFIEITLILYKNMVCMTEAFCSKMSTAQLLEQEW